MMTIQYRKKCSSILRSVLCLVLVSCASVSKEDISNVQENEVVPADWEKYFPLRVGERKRFSVHTIGMDEAIEREIIITKSDEEGFFHDNNGSRFQIRRSGIFDGERYLIQTPVRVGNKWRAIMGLDAVEQYEILSTQEQVQIPAGIFSDCLVVRALQQTQNAQAQHVEIELKWVYAPDVGLVHMEQWVRTGQERTQIGAQSLIHVDVVRGTAHE